MQKFFADSPPLRLCLTVHTLGPDVCLHLFGGTAAGQPHKTEDVLGAHVGAVVLALPNGDTTHGSDASAASASVLSVPGHREDLLARRLALLAAQRLQTPVVLVCGIHVDNATTAIIQDLENMAHDLVQEMLHALTVCQQKETPCCS